MSANPLSPVSSTLPIPAPDSSPHPVSVAAVSAQETAKLVDELIVILQLENRQLEGKLKAVNVIVNAYSKVINYQAQLLSDMEDLLIKHNIPLPPLYPCTFPATPPPSPA